jgi:hypothetical protein
VTQKPFQERLALLAEPEPEPESDVFGPKPKREWIDDPDEFRRAQQDYLQSLSWQQKRMAVLARDQYLCQCCRKDFATHVHHKHYRNWRVEDAADLMSVCPRCHAFYHDKKVA